MGHGHRSGLLLLFLLLLGVLEWIHDTTIGTDYCGVGGGIGTGMVVT